MAAVASISRASGWAVCTPAPLRAAESRADSSRRGTAAAQQRNPVRVKVAADGVVEHVVLGSHRDIVKPMARVCRGVAGPRCAESMLRDRGANNQCRCGRPHATAGDAAAVGGSDWQQADSRGSGRGNCAHGSVIPRDTQSRGAGQPSGLRWTMSVRLCAQGLLLWNVPWVARVV